MMERRASQEIPIDLIESGQFLSAEEMFSERRTDDPLEMVIRAEVEMYFGRLDEAASLLQEVAPRASEIEVAARFSLASGRLATWRAEFESANTHLQTAYFFYKFQQDSFRTSQALLELGRLSRLRVELDDAQAKLNLAQDGIKGRTSKRSEFLRGMVSSEAAALSIDRGEHEQATEHYAAAMRLLKGTERGRYYGRTLVGLASVKCSQGSYQDSLELFKEANIIFERYDLKNDLAECQLALAKALIRRHGYERAERLCEESRDLKRGQPLGESMAFGLLAILGLKRNGTDEASNYAINAVELADESGFDDAKAEARTILGQVRLAEREFQQAVDALLEAAGIGRRRDSRLNPKWADHAPVSILSRRLELEATIYLAEAYHNVDTRAGRNELARAEEILKDLDNAWLEEEFDRVSKKYEEQIVF